MTTTEQLDRFPLLADLDEETRAAVHDRLVHRTVPEGTVLVREGEPSDGLHLLVVGQVSVVVDGDPPHEVAVLGPRSFFGEMSLLDSGPAKATVTAMTDLELATLPADGPEPLADLPALRASLEDTAARRHTSNSVVDLEPALVEVGGMTVALRPLWPDDWRLMATSLPRSSPESLRRRFFSVPNLTEHTLRRLARVDWTDHFAWAVLEGGVDGPLVAVGRYGRIQGTPHVVELALLVADDLHGRGIGRLLVGALAVAASHHPGVTHFAATALADNVPVQGLLTRYGAVFGPGDRGQEVAAEWPVADALAATPEAVREAAGPLARLVLTGHEHD